VTVLWVSGRFRAGETAVLASGIAQVLGTMHALHYWPLGPARPWAPAGFSHHLEPAPAPAHLLARVGLIGQIRRRLPEYDVVVVEQDLETEFLVAEAAGGLRARPRLVLIATLALGHYLAGRGEHRAARPRRQVRAWYPRYDRILCLLDGVQRDLRDRFGLAEDRVQSLPWPALPGPVDVPPFRPMLVTAGFVDGIAGWELLVQGVALLRESGIPAGVQAFGDGPRLSVVQELADRLHVPLSVEPLSLERATHLAGGVYHSPLWLDGTGWQLVQAARAGLPLTAVSAPEAAYELTRGGILGRLAPLGDLPRLRDVLEPLLTDERARQGYRVGAGALAQRHDPARVGDRWLSAFAEFSAPKGRY
jgi:glycosyltransferase involved in cell wall biosynthesis